MVQEVLAPGPQERYDIDANDESLPLLQELKERYGDICRVMTKSRASDSLVINDPDHIRHVLLTNRANYVKGVGLERVRVLLGNGLIVNDGESWARQRRMMQPVFHSQVIRGFSTFMERLNLELIERWAGHAERGEPINLTRELSEVTLSIVLRALFSVDLDRLISAEGSSPFDLLTRDTRRDLPFAAKFRALTRHVLGMIDVRRRERRVEMDLLSMLMEARDRDTGEAMPDRALLDEIMTLIVAGHETTASTLNWTWYLLSQHPEAEARLHESISAATPPPAPMAALPDAPPQANSYVERVLQEAMRLYPPGWLFTRRALKDDQLGRYHVPAGTDVFICAYLLHRHAKHWERPNDFDPERFVPAAAESRHRFAFLPFSAGPRYCIGAGFAMTEMTMHMSMVSKRFRLQYASNESPQAEFQINLRTRQDVHMHVVAR
ncbi:MAG: cytochrome P450 [Rhizobacter sp.]